MRVVITDGGRRDAGFCGDTGDCVVRAVAIATEQPYAEVYAVMAEGNRTQRRSKHFTKPRRSARHGIYTNRKWFKDYLTALGWVWTPTMHIGSGCTVHLTDGELPMGRLIVMVSRHATAVIDGVIYDTHDPQRESVAIMSGEIITREDGTKANKIIGWTGQRCVYGYWSKSRASEPHTIPEDTPAERQRAADYWDARTRLSAPVKSVTLTDTDVLNTALAIQRKLTGLSGDELSAQLPTKAFAVDLARLIINKGQ